MVYKYIRKSDRASWSEENLITAVEKVKRNEIPLKKASKLYEIPYTTLRKHVQKGTSKKFLGRYKPVFDMKEEAELINYVNKMDEIFFGLTKTDVCSLAYKFADSRGIDHPFKNETAGDQWYTSFMLRHPEVRLTPADRANISRPKPSYDSQIECFFELLKTLLKKYKFPSKKIYNMGEVRIHYLGKELPRIVTVEDGRQLMNSAENEVLITTIFCCSAVGSFIPPVLIFPEKNYNEKLSSDLTCMRSKNGCNNSDLCLDWLKYFIRCTRPTENEKVLLILENHEWYKNVEFYDYAIANNVVILSLPHRCSHKLHPLHISVFGSTRSHFQDIAQNRWKDDDSDSFLNLKSIFIEAYLKSVKLQNAIRGFEESGILKCHKDFVSEDCLPEMCQTIDNGSFLENNFSLIKREKINSIRIDLQKKSETRRNRVIKAPIFKTFSLTDLKTSQSKVIKKLPKKSKRVFHTPISTVKNNFRVPEPVPIKTKVKEECVLHTPISAVKNNFRLPEPIPIKANVKEECVLRTPTFDVKNNFQVPRPPVIKNEVKEESDESVVQIIYELELDF